MQVENLSVEDLSRHLVGHLSPEIIRVLNSQNISGALFMCLTPSTLKSFNFQLCDIVDIVALVSDIKSGKKELSYVGGNEQVRHLLCIYCNPYKFLGSVDKMKEHFTRLHGNLSSYMCGKCKKTFLHKTSFIRHIQQQHVLERTSSQSSEGLGTSSASSQSGFAGDGREEDGGEDGIAGREDGIDRVQDEGQAGGVQNLGREAQTSALKEIASKFILNLRSSGNMTNASIEMVMDNVLIMLKNILLKAGDETRAFLNSTNVSAEDAAVFIEGSTFTTENIFDGLASVDDQLNYYCEKFGLVIPEEKLLGTRIEDRFDRSLRMFVPKQIPETFQYISLVDTLTLIIKNAHLRNLILSENQSQDGVYRSYKDGTDFKNNMFLTKYPYAVRIVLYYDGLEIANALGSKDTVHQLGCFYISIQNLPAEESSLLSSIFLLALCYAQDLKKPGAYEKVLALFRAELHKLQSDEGVEIELPGGEKFILRACLVSLSADTLAAHEVLGLLGPSAGKFCRACLISKKDLKEETTFIGPLRTSRQHEEHVREVQERPASSSRYGVKEKSPLSDVMRVPEDSAFDVFHDLVGVIQMIVKWTLYEYICVRKLFSVDDFNLNVNRFVYGKPDAKNKPSPNLIRKRLYSKGHTLKQYGSQTFCLLRVLPFLISGVDETDRFLQLVFLLQDAVKVIFSFEFRDSDINRLETLLYQFGTLFHEIFISLGPAVAVVQDNQTDGNAEDDDDDDDDDDDSEEEDGEEDEEDDEEDEEDEDDEDEVEIDDPALEQPRRRRRRVWKSCKLKKTINKMHHLMHYPQQMREKGPIIRLWCARFEGRHRILRKHSGVQQNFKNPPKTMAKMFQLSTLAAFLDRNAPYENSVSCTGSVCHSVSQNPYCRLLLSEGLQENDQIRVVESAHVCGEEYQPGLFIMLKQDEAQVRPLFAVIMDVLVVSSEFPRVFLVVNKCRNITMSGRYNCYKISNQFDETPVLVDRKCLANHRPIAPWVPLDRTDLVSLYLYPRTVSV